MRYSEDHKEAVRERIIAQASAALRAGGLEGASIPQIMKRAGLTHGSFYCHFADRDELVAEAVRAAGEETGGRVFEPPADGKKEMLARYLSAEHRDHPDHGCVLAALGSEGRRQTPVVRRAFAHVARGFLRLVQRKLHPKVDPGELGDDALRLASQMVGAVVLSRLVEDEALSKRLLDAARG
jgi:TetR/AcrR family transcriptional repressor of nem operon